VGSWIGWVFQQPGNPLTSGQLNFLQSRSVGEAIEIGAINESTAKRISPKSSGRLSVARAFERVIFFSLLMLIVLTAIPYGTVQPWWIALFECLVFLLGVLAIVERLMSERWSPKNLSVATPLVGLVLFILFQSVPLFSSDDSSGLPRLTLAVSADPYNTRLVAVRLFALIVVGGLLLVYTSSKKRLRAVVSVVIGVGLLSAFFGVVRAVFQQSPGFVLPALFTDGRSFAQFVNRNHFGFLIEMALGLTLGLLVRGSSGYRRFTLLLPIAAFMWVVLIFSNSRGAIFASLCQVLFLVLMLDPLGHVSKQTGTTVWGRVQNVMGGFAVRAILIGFLIVLFAYGVSWVGGEAVVSNFQLAGYSFSQQGAQGNRENVSRKDIWAATWQLAKARPIAGAGFGGYWIAITKYHNASGSYTPQEAHNDYLELLASGGIIGCALVAWFGVRFIKGVRKTLQAPDRFVRAAALGAVTGIFGVLIHSFVDFGLHITINALVLSALIPIALQLPIADSLPQG
jgi:O-antigen ligase